MVTFYKSWKTKEIAGFLGKRSGNGRQSNGNFYLAALTLVPNTAKEKAGRDINL